MTIPARFCGPSGSGNGGWSAAVAAATVATSLTEPAIEVTLRRPPPLDTPLEVRPGDRDDDGHGRASCVLVDHDGTVVAEACRSALVLPVLPPPSADQIDAAPPDPSWTVEHHAFPDCFVCGPARGTGDGLRLFPHRIAEGLSPRFATRLDPPPDLVTDGGTLDIRAVWAALDCPSAFPFLTMGTPAVVLGRITAEICRTARLDDPARPLVVTSWRRGPSSGRKHHGGAALFAGTSLVARAAAVWIELPA